MIVKIFNNQYGMAGASLIFQLVKMCLQCRRPWFNFWIGKIPWRRHRLPTTVLLGFPGSTEFPGKEFACNVGDLDSFPGLRRSPGWEHSNPLQYSCLENTNGQRSLVGYSPWGHRESDRTERLNTAHYHIYYNQCNKYSLVKQAKCLLDGKRVELWIDS